MNTNTSPEQKDQVMKMLAVLGFIVLLILTAWLAIQIIRLLPSAFSSLASLADSVYNPEQQDEGTPLDMVPSNNVVSSRAPFTLVWSDLGEDGVYTLTYSCTSGVSLDIRTGNGATTPINCDEPYVLPQNVYEAELSFTSERDRFTDVAYSITFTPDNTKKDSLEIGKTITVVNASIPYAGSTDDTDTTDDADDTEIVDTTTPDTTTPTTNQPTRYRYVKTTTYTYPVSDPNGYTELEVAYRNVGVLRSNNTFVVQPTLTIGDRGAFQFEVKNTGTKTSSSWDFEAKLPSGTTYESKSQDPLKPQERAIITIAFDDVGDAGIHEFKVIIDGGNDQSKTNNSFSWSVGVRK